MRRLRRAHQRNARRRKKFKQRAITTAAAITLGIGAAHNYAPAQYIPDTHELPVAHDTDADSLADSEEAALAYLNFNPDQNRNGIPDGVELARLSAAEVNDLPWQDQAAPGQTYKWWAPQFGVESCDICGETVGMGPGGVVNPQLAISVQFPFLLTLHYMQHGSFSYAGHYGDHPVNGRIDVPALAKALQLRLPCDPNDHQLPVANDADNDLLSNKEEFALGYQPFKPDQNRNEIPDGVELARRCATVVAELPVYPLGQPPSDANQIYKMEHALDGVERCYICGQWIHMGGWEIVNPNLGLKYPDPNDPLDGTFLPDLALHYMQHGSFHCYGDIHQGRTNIPRLLTVLQLRFPYDPNEHQVPPDSNDLDGDLITDTEELAAGYNLYDPDQNQNLNPDGIELANQCVQRINELPLYDPHAGDPEPKVPYKVNRFQRGIETCHICGAIRNMGCWLIVNPRLAISMEVPDITCHFMEHGSFSYGGDVHGWARIHVPLLAKLLELPHRCSDLGTLYLPGDLNKDCQLNFADLADLAHKWLQSTDPNDD